MGELTIVFLPVIWTIGWAYALMPQFGRQVVSELLGFCFRLAGFKAGVVRQNLKYAFPSDDLLRDRIERESYREFAKLVLEIFMLPGVGPFPGAMRYFVERQSRLIGVENWKAALSSGRGGIFVASHVGNWEVMAATGALLGGIDLMIVTKQVKPFWLHEAIKKGRLRCGVKCTYEPKTMKDVLGQLRKGGTVGFVLDQYAGPPIGIRVPVFGVPVGTLGAPAALAKRTGAALIPVLNYRKNDGRTEVVIRKPHLWLRDDTGVDSEREIALNTAALAQQMEADIRAHPGQWLWSHRRFKGDLSPLRPHEWEEGRSRK